MDELRERVRAYYEKNRITFAKLAKDSEIIFGQKLSPDQLRKWSERDGGWIKPKITNDDKLSIIAERIFELIEEEGATMSPKDLAALANSYREFAVKAMPQSSGDSKPTLQQIIDIANQEVIDAVD